MGGEQYAARQAEAARQGPPRAFELDGDVYALTGSWWPLVEHLANASWRLPLLLDIVAGSDSAVLLMRLHDMDDPLAASDLDRIADRLVQAATGLPWWAAGRLLLWAHGHWGEFDGAMSMRGLDMAELVDVRPARACAVVYAYLIEGADRKERDKLDHSLWTPPPGLDQDEKEREWAAADEGEMFMAAMGGAGNIPGMRIGGTEPNAHLSGS